MFSRGVDRDVVEMWLSFVLTSFDGLDFFSREEGEEKHKEIKQAADATPAPSE